MDNATVRPVIHVGLDASWRTSGALEWALQEAELRHEPLDALHVIDERVRRTPYWEPNLIDDAAMQLVGEVQAYLDSSPSRLDHEMDLVVGPPAETLVRRATGGSMLVVGRRGIGAFRRLLIGSTSEAVTAGATVPVVVIPDQWKPADHNGPVVIGLDESGDDQAAMEFAVTEATERRVPLRLVHVWDLPNLYSWEVVNASGLVEEWDADVRRTFHQIAEQWRAKYPDLAIDVDVWRGHPVDGIVRAAEQHDAQLLVVGSHRRHRLPAMLLGSVARGVVQHATRPVAVVHEPAGR
ncbi:universal stress protein [Kribbella sp. NPDC050124]|uniref:universal stress protein n=1 Tax=Kribbella sp. NPDC050124 TaxID=3364114 RepID=UPI0037945E87